MNRRCRWRPDIHDLQLPGRLGLADWLAWKPFGYAQVIRCFQSRSPYAALLLGIDPGAGARGAAARNKYMRLIEESSMRGCDSGCVARSVLKKISTARLHLVQVSRVHTQPQQHLSASKIAFSCPACDRVHGNCYLPCKYLTRSAFATFFLGCLTFSFCACCD